MPKNKTYISVGDFLDVYNKLNEKGFQFLLTKLKLKPKSRVEAKWDSYESTSDFWLIPEITQHWNYIISGNKTTIYEDYVVQKYFQGKSNLKLLSIGCGEGLHERNFAKHSCFSVIDGIDVSKESIEKAKQIAEKDKLPINYYCGDFKEVELELESYDVVLFSSSLHHFKDVDSTLKDHVSKLLKPNGFLIVFEYCGPNRLQWSDAQLKKANQLLQTLPIKYKKLYQSSRTKNKVYRPGILRMLLVDPSEAVDSEAIEPSLKKHFEVIEKKNLGWNILHILLKGIAHNFINEEKETKDLLTFLIQEEEKFVEENKVTDAIFGVYRKSISI